MKPKVYKDKLDKSWVVEVYANGVVPLRLYGFSSANNAVNVLKHQIFSCIIGGHVLVIANGVTFCKNCRAVVETERVTW